MWPVIFQSVVLLTSCIACFTKGLTNGPGRDELDVNEVNSNAACIYSSINYAY